LVFTCCGNVGAADALQCSIRSVLCSLVDGSKSCGSFTARTYRIARKGASAEKLRPVPIRLSRIAKGKSQRGPKRFAPLESMTGKPRGVRVTPGGRRRTNRGLMGAIVELRDDEQRVGFSHARGRSMPFEVQSGHPDQVDRIDRDDVRLWNLSQRSFRRRSRSRVPFARLRRVGRVDRR